jgi:DNA-binding CsgD family transcriptional regulator
LCGNEWALARHSGAPPGLDANSSTNGVMLDVEVDDVRCVWVRLRAGSVRPRVVLSPREREIARMVAKGYPNQTIAAVLDISSWTVCTHLRRMFAKPGVTTRSAMVASMAEAGDEWPPKSPAAQSRAVSSE